MPILELMNGKKIGLLDLQKILCGETNTIADLYLCCPRDM